jgi:ABC-type siderophore export system fused ATPase/permease subunit
MQLLPFIVAYLIAPTLVIVVAYIFAAMLGLTVVAMIILCAVSLAGYIVFKVLGAVRDSQNPIHKTNKKYLKGRLLHLP